MPPRGLAGLAANTQPLGATAGSSGIDKAITEMHGAPTELLCPEGGPPWPAMPRLLCATAASSRQMELVKEWLPHCQGHPLSSGTACSLGGHTGQSRKDHDASSLYAASMALTYNKSCSGASSRSAGRCRPGGASQAAQSLVACSSGAWNMLPGETEQPAGLSPQTGPNTVGTTNNRGQPARRSPQTEACAGCLIRLQQQSCRLLSSAAEQLTEGRGRGALGCRACCVACGQGQPTGPRAGTYRGVRQSIGLPLRGQRAPSCAVVAASCSLHPLQAGLKPSSQHERLLIAGHHSHSCGKREAACAVTSASSFCNSPTRLLPIRSKSWCRCLPMV